RWAQGSSQVNLGTAGRKTGPRTLRSMRYRVLSALAALSLVLAARGTATNPTHTAPPENDATDEPPDQETGAGVSNGETSQWGLPVIDPLDVDPGIDIGIAGSSTVFPLSTALISQWIDEGGPEYSIDSIGSGGGLERFCVEGGSDIANASRAIQAEEAQ